MDVLGFIIDLLKSAVVIMFPLLMPSLGEAISERSGVLHIGLEAYMLVGALVAYYGAYLSHNCLIGLIAGMVSGALLSWIYGFCDYPKSQSDHLRSWNMAFWNWIHHLSLSITAFSRSHRRSSDVHIPVLSGLPVIGPILFQQNVLVYLGVLLVVVSYLFLYQTPFGLVIRATGDNPLAVDMAGKNVYFVRYVCVTLCSAFAGIAYPEMAVAKMRQIGDEIRARWPVDRMAIVHRVGRLGIGEASVAIAVASPHRHEVLQACAHAIEQLKEIVPIWKKEVWSDGAEWIGSTVDEYRMGARESAVWKVGSTHAHPPAVPDA